MTSVARKIFIGWDPREKVASEVAAASFRRRTAAPLDIRFLKLDRLRESGVLTRPVETREGRLWCPISDAPMATEFAISRFALPFLVSDGWALFVDSDVVCLADVEELFALADDRYAVMCVQHQHAPVSTTKMDGQIQTTYSRKNWSSVMLIHCGHEANRRLTHADLNGWPGRHLHAFRWLEDHEIGALPPEWNYLVGHSIKGPEPIKIAHFTEGGPFLPNWPGGPMDHLWLNELNF
jgi:hypothetical protein